MPSQDYGWKRFWCPRSKPINLSCGGYLCDPEAKWGHIYNPDLVNFEAISALPCLALLGEPGIGKTRALETEQKKIISKIQQQGGQVLALDIRSIRDENRLVNKIFNSPKFNEWLQGNHQLHIFVDSFDECLLRIDILATLLLDELKDYRDEINRLNLRIACRTAVWPDILEEGLKEIWGKDNVGIYKLAPLRRVDVSQAAKIADIQDTEAFLEEINKKNVVPLAIKPITLKFLINTYHDHGEKFPDNQRLHELYFKGCLWLCEERNPSRVSSKLIGKFDRQQRLIVAARIAAITIFGKKSAIWTGIDWGDVPDDDVLREKICHGTENVEGRDFEITQETVDEVLDTGLFSSRGELNRIGWAHQTYAEFLAAWYLKERQIKLPQILKLIVHPDDPENRIIPQLYETVAWLASLLPEVFQEVMKTDPHVLLQSDVATASDNDKAALVESLLKLHNEEKLTYQYNTWLYQNLDHPKLPEQLQLYICDETKSINARNVAIDIANACSVKGVQEYLANVALDPQQHSWIRTNAAEVVCNLGDEKTKARLKPLAVAQIQDDVEEQLKGCGLRAVWPGNITAQELFDTLIQPVSTSIGGRYQDFIARELGQYLQISDLPLALNWLKKQVTRHNLRYPFGELSDAIMLKAWEHLDEPEVMQAFARVAVLRLKNHDVIVDDDPYKTISFSKVLKNDVQKRHQLVESIIPIIPELDKEPLWLIGYRTAIVFEEDFQWLIECLQKSENEHHQKIWAKLLRWNFRRTEVGFEHLDAVLTASQTNLILRKEFESLVEPIDLCSPRAQQEQERYLEQQQWINEDEKKPILEPPLKERLLEILNQIEAGQSHLWYSLCFELSPESYSNPDSFLLKSNLVSLPGWIAVEDSTKERIIQAARLYLTHGEPDNQAWLGTNNFRYSALLGYQALLLLQQQAPALISSLSADEWQKWTAIILAYRYWGRTEDQEHYQELIKQAYQNAPNEFIKVLIKLIEKDNREHGDVYIKSLIINCWDKKIAQAIFDKVQDKELTNKSIGNLLDDLLKYGFTEAKAFAESLIALPINNSGEDRAKAIAAACSLLLYAEDAGWSVVWSAIQEDTAFGREVLEKITFSFEYSGSLEQRLPEKHIADLYIFLAKQYPDSDSKKQNITENEKVVGIEAYTVTPQHSIKTWRNYIPQRIQERGTPQACEALRKIICELPELKDKLQWRLLEAETLARRQTWQPFKLEEILQIVSQKKVSPMKTILFLAANPKNSTPLRLDEEVREIHESLRRSNKRDQFNKLEQRWAVRTSDLRRALLDTEPQIVHFCGHGSGNQGLVIEDENGQSKLLSTEALAKTFKLCAEHVECVLLNACYSEVQAEVIVEHIDYVIGMSDAIGDTAAIEFATGFYDALGAGKSIETAYEWGCTAIQSENLPDYLKPKLKKKK
ncbi:CHAT domain-containing protein [Nostoc sp. CMAA1605]|uniref:CHAT domain-containing protein n=1 Tax=Nostoc sp. CMAA1605 TaxID=2055159 RepID=UPI001F2D3F05|nr:CHAT domain-containing protein [Nostoc sp. CMAA1605]